MHGWIHFHLYSLDYAPLSRRTSPQHQQRWYMALPFACQENFSPPLPPPPCLILQILCYNSSHTFNLFDLNHLESLNATVTSLTTYLLPLTCLLDMMVYANHYSHHTMDRSPSSAELTNISLSLSMVEMTLSQLIDSSLLTSIQKIHIHPKTLLNHNLILHPLILHPPPLAVLVLDDMFISLLIYLTTCNTLGGSCRVL